MNLLDYIPHGRENAVAWQRLCDLTGWDKRKVRKEIKAQIKMGHAILSTSGRSGYWISNNIDEIERYLKESKHRCRTEFETNVSLRRYVADVKGLQMVPVRAHMRRIHADKQIEGQVKL